VQYTFLALLLAVGAFLVVVAVNLFNFRITMLKFIGEVLLVSSIWIAIGFVVLKFA
jgi:hypothetical protein